jgi:hypothetical protein
MMAIRKKVPIKMGKEMGGGILQCLSQGNFEP